MTRRLISTLAATLALVAATPALAWSGPQATAQAAAPSGLDINAVSGWITSKGGVVSPIQREQGETFFTVQDGELTWMVFFYGCTGDVCTDIQYSAVFSNAAITLEKINAWNQGQRFLKAAFFAPGSPEGQPSTVVQYDLLLQPGGVEQLNDPTGVWVGLVDQFARHVGYFE
ncbi:hypothetical protein GVN24_30090 [Rhizobium sp. CRIBSB]|nr:hypothetical protein [Rhizobium sp. CRIBSB]